MDDDRDLQPLAPRDAALVRRIAELAEPPTLSRERRVAFHARLEERIARRGSRRLYAVVGGAAVAAALLATLVWLPATTEPGPIRVTRLGAAPATPSAEDAILAIATEPLASSEEDSLPEDYRAIAGLFL